ncbi:hypothetical protein HYQ46_008170 [Verticillium longisporum]|nr:hypothetical protein HYQ46_008170 [Verticillium longisporum]
MDQAQHPSQSLKRPRRPRVSRPSEASKGEQSGSDSTSRKLVRQTARLALLVPGLGLGLQNGPGPGFDFLLLLFGLL